MFLGSRMLSITDRPGRCYLDQGVVRAVRAEALDGDLGVAVVVAVVVADPHQLAVVGRGRGVAHLRGQEVGESLAGEPVHVVDGVALPGQRVDEHPGARGDGRLGDLRQRRDYI